MSSKSIPQGSLVLLWAGEDPAVHAALLEELEAEEIPFSDKSLGDDEAAPTTPPLPIDWKPRFGFEVAVLFADLAAAQELLEKLLEEEPADLEIPERDGVAAAEPPLVVATETHPKVEVFGVEAMTESRNFLPPRCRKTKLQCTSRIRVTETRIYVSASNDKHAREIVREVVEGAHPGS